MSSASGNTVLAQELTGPLELPSAFPWGGGVFCVLLMVGRYCRRLPSSQPGLQLHRQDNHQETVTVSVLGDTTVTVCNNDMLVKTINIC